MSRQKPGFLSVLLLLVLALTPSLQANENLLADAKFSRYGKGEAPGAPWKTKAEGEHARIVRQSPPIENASDNWIHLVDRDQDVKVYMRTPVGDIRKGQLDFKLHFPDGAGTLFVYLVGEPSERDNDNIVEFKVLESSGNIYVGAHHNRNLLPFKFDSTPTLDISLEFEATPAGEAIAVYLNEDGQRNLVHRQTYPGGGTVKEISLGTDTVTAQTEVYLGDLSLTPQ